MKRIFISYKRLNKDKVFPLVKRIEQELGVKCWVDLDGIESSAQFASVICNAIDRAEVVLFMHSSVHLDIDFENDWTIDELNYAHATNKKVLLVKLDDAPLKNIFLMKYGTKNNIDSNVPEQMEKMIRDLRGWLKLEGKDENKPVVEIEPEVEDITARVICEKGEECYKEGNYDDAAKWYRKSADLGWAPAQYKLAHCYYYGEGVEMNDEEAVRWFRKSAEQGYIDALNYMGDIYSLGEGVAADFQEAVKFYNKSAEQGNEYAKSRLELLKMMGVI